MELAIVWNIVITLLGCVLFQGCWTRVTNSGKELLVCYHCEEIYFGSCGRGYNLNSSSCHSNDKTCFYKSYYDPFNNGHGGKFKYERGCTPCDSEKCLASATLFRSGVEDFLGTMKICDSPNCNSMGMNALQIDDPLGVKIDGNFV
ncbi:uncharacterized protein LOC123313824 isoform X1 [Coccinella septempunctata]|uniref:uncharacterized protein LOC123313824 isoform X1 n=1 Tax=Coccinella septempunctata TaxID=41139 RepID=UPI001D07654B|nr:uncharacterized protein LOC123313824 isoform X1 [Coccinella septempunctata]